MFRIVLSVRHASSQNIRAGPMKQVYTTNLLLLSVSVYRFIYSAFASFRQGARKEKRGRWNFLIPFGRDSSSFPDGTLPLTQQRFPPPKVCYMGRPPPSYVFPFYPEDSFLPLGMGAVQPWPGSTRGSGQNFLEPTRPGSRNRQILLCKVRFTRHFDPVEPNPGRIFPTCAHPYTHPPVRPSVDIYMRIDMMLFPSLPFFPKIEDGLFLVEKNWPWSHARGKNGRKTWPLRST